MSNLAVALNINVAGNALSALKSTQKQTKAFNNSLSNTKTVADKASSSINKNAKALKRSADEAVKANSKFKQFRGMLKSFAGLAVVGAGISMLKNTVNSLKEVEVAQASLRATAKIDKTSESYKRLDNEAEKLAGTTNFSKVQVLSAMDAMASEGQTTAQILSGIEAVTTASAASMGRVDLVSSAQNLSGALGAYQKDASESMKITDMFARATQVTSLKMHDLKNVARDTSLAAGMGQDFGTMASMVGMIKKITGSTEIAGTQVKGFSRSIANIKADQNTIKGLKKYGISLFDSKGKAKDFKTIVSDIESNLNKLNNPFKKAAILKKIFTDSEAMQGYNNIVKLGAGNWKKNAEAINIANGVGKKFEEEFLNTYAGKIELLKSAWDSFSRKLLAFVFPIIIGIAKAFTLLLSDTTAKTPQWIIGLKAVFSSIWGVIKIVANSIKDMWSKVSAGDSAGNVFSSIAEKVKFLITILEPVMHVATNVLAAVLIVLNKIGESSYVLEIVAGGVVVVWLAFKGYKVINSAIAKVKDFIVVVKSATLKTWAFSKAIGTKMMSGLKAFGMAIKSATLKALAFSKSVAISAAKGLKAFGKSILSAIPKVLAFSATLLASPITWIVLGVIALGAAVYFLIKHWDKVTAFFKKLWSGIKKIFKVAWDWIKGLFLKYTPAGLIIKHWDKISAFFSKLWNGIKKAFKVAWDWIKGLLLKYTPAGLVIKHWSKIAAFFRRLWQGIKTITIIIWNAIVSFIKVIPERILGFFAGVGTKIVNTISNGIKNAGKGIYSAVKSVFGWAGRLIPGSDAKEGPFSTLTKSGQGFITAFGKGIDSKANHLKSVTAKTFGNAMPNVITAKQKLKVGFNSTNMQGGTLPPQYQKEKNEDRSINIHINSIQIGERHLQKGSEESQAFEEQLKDVFERVLERSL